MSRIDNIVLICLYLINREYHRGEAIMTTLENIVGEMQKNIFLTYGSITEWLKKEYGMIRAVSENRLSLENGERILTLNLEFWWHTLKTDEKTIQKNANSIEEIEKAFAKEEWHMSEKKDEPYDIDIDGFRNIHLQRLSLKKTYLIRISNKTAEAEK